MKTKNKNKTRDSVPFRLQGRALFPLQDRGRSTHKWALNGCSNLHELGAQLVDLTKITKRKKNHTWKNVLKPCRVENMTASCLLSNVEKRRFLQAALNRQEEVKPGTTARCSTLRPTE